MGFGLFIRAIEAFDDKEIEDVRKKHAAYLACKEAGVQVPPELESFFDGLEVFPKSQVPFDEFVKSCGKTHMVYSLNNTKSNEFGNLEAGNEHGVYLIDLSKLPKRTKFLRVYPSY